MKRLIQTLNWKNFLQRTFLFFFVFVIIRLIVDWVENDLSLVRILQQSMLRYLIFAMVLGFLDSETWFHKNGNQTKQDEPQKFSGFKSAFLHYAGVAFFSSLLCGIILTFFSVAGWLISMLSGQKNVRLFPNWGMYLLVIAVIGICFAGYDALRNYQRLQKKG